MATQPDGADSLLDLLSVVLEEGRAEPLLGRLAPGAVVWHNDDKLDRDAVENMKRAGELHRVLRDVRVEVVRREPLSDGLLQQFVIHGTAAGTGRPVAAHNCLVVRVDAGLISRIEEYVDPTFGAQLGLGT
jgi:ketosteroid isomerase-like protein